MSESCSTSKSHDSFNTNVIKKPVRDIFNDDNAQNDTNYIRLYDCLRTWLSTTDMSNKSKRAIQLDFYYNCMKRYDEKIDERLKYVDEFKGIIYKSLFNQLMPDFCIVDNYNYKIKSLSSGLDLEYLPMHIVSVLELKMKLKDSDIGQLIHYLRIIFDYSSSSRSSIVGAITDFNDIQFAMIMRGEDDQIYHYASLKAFRNANEYLLHHLAMFFTVDHSKFGFYRLQPLPSDILIGNRLLGIGANSMVFNCSLTDGLSNEYVLKISNKPVNKEVSIYQKLYVEKYEVIQVHQYALLFRHPPGTTISTENIFNQIDVIWNQVKAAHQYGILHRDLRKSNIIELFNNKTNRLEILLIDWDSSTEIGSNVQYSGTLSTASNFILRTLANNRNSLIECLPIDDCISFMKMILLEMIPKGLRDALSSEVQQESFSGILLVYDEMKNYFENKQLIVTQIIDLLEKNRGNFDEKKLTYFMDQCVKNPQWLFKLEYPQTDVNSFNDLLQEVFPS